MMSWVFLSCRFTHLLCHRFFFRIAGLEPLEAIAREFDSLKNPLEDWLLQQTEAFDSLPPVEIAGQYLSLFCEM